MKKIFFLTILFFLLSTSLVSARGGFPSGCDEPFGIPSACPVGCGTKNQTGCFEPDTACVTARILDPSFTCCPNKCRGDSNVDPGSIDDSYSKLDVFGTNISISPNKIPTLINLAFSAFLGFVSFFALLRGMYLGAFKRPDATTPEDIQNINKEIQNLVIGFVLAWSFIFIIQLVLGILGIPDISSLNFDSEGSGNQRVIVIE